jgi:putative ABC transport system permease protein
VAPVNGLDEQVAEQQLLTLSGVRSVSALSGSFTNRFNGMNIPAWVNNRKDAISLNYYFADAGFIKNMNLLLVAGSNFSTTAAGSEERSVIVNEEAVKALGIKDYQKALGQRVWINDSTRLEIAGVVKNFIYENAGNPVRPLAFRNRVNSYSYLYITTDAKNNQALAERVNETLKTLAPTQTFTSVWLDEELERSNSQVATISLLGYLAFIAAAIASLGLLGLVIYTVEVKRKEISIRKIIGASEKELVRLLSKGFIKLLIIAGCIAVPIGYAAGFLFLQNFVIRVPFGVSVAVLCFVFLLCIGLVTIVSQTWKAAVANPVKDLRME